jgi:peptidoglycan/LPS O-acetylase OafA/YrhL
MMNSWRHTVNAGFLSARNITWLGWRSFDCSFTVVSMRLPKEFSTFLDLLRLAAAVVVFLGHLSDQRFGGELLPPFLPLAKSAVIAFFVLSGYVISWSATRERSATDYAINRAARIYSVALPAILLTWAIDLALQAHDPGAIQSGYQLAQPWKYLPVFLTFTTDFWFLNENAFSNIPYWSLCYEVWYYVVFGIFFFGPARWRWLLAGLVLASTGPRLWLLFPTWLLGVAIRRAHERVALERRLALTLCACAVGALVLTKASGIEALLNDWFDAALGGFPTAKLRYSQNVLGDSLVAAWIGLAIFAARDADFTWLNPFHGLVRGAASISFSLYLTHFPLLLAYGALFPRQCILVGACAAVSAAVFGVAFELRKQVLRRILLRLADEARLRLAPYWPATKAERSTNRL